MQTFTQKTIVREGSISGIGLHSGEKCGLTVKPAPVNSGIRFLKNGKVVRESLQAASDPSHRLRCTAIGEKEELILTVEHLLSAFFGVGVTNIDIHVNGPEIPGLDGSAKEFVQFIKSLGILDQSVPYESYKITEPIFCHSKISAAAVYPADEFSVAYTLDYDHPFLRNQKVDFQLKPGIFEKEIAPARTFCTEVEAAELKKMGFGSGADYSNTLVISETGPIKNELRFPDECARHKVLDMLGDLNLLGFAILGRVVGLRSGHMLNKALIEAIKKQRGSI